MAFTVTILGCGTSTGVPVPGCQCPVCLSPDPRNSRLRTSIHLDFAGRLSVLVDTSPDLRQQALAAGIRRVDAVLYTHSHADHILGFDDLRSFNFAMGDKIDCYSSATTLELVKKTFWYTFDQPSEPLGGPVAKVNMLPIEAGKPFSIKGQEFLPFELLHGRDVVLGYRCGRFAYATDCNFIPEPSYEILKGTEILILDGLREQEHRTHFNFQQSIAAAQRIGAKRTILIHMSHAVDYQRTSAELPAGIELAVDGMQVVIP